eukprot:CAMPEP_0178454182 /NCGR_PEP_ID=MMETSP0689_2-20121128/45216_1 /TAXON_ID=160604 /ORGANISM="Amphidinium massartii, Strain CS-259" /LENGTH=117 /DNA_ID=CAMNT_0020080087 /DNA_START=551 /DNA_END=905 /DNA_ORIENTATION=-
MAFSPSVNTGRRSPTIRLTEEGSPQSREDQRTIQAESQAAALPGQAFVAFMILAERLIPPGIHDEAYDALLGGCELFAVDLHCPGMCQQQVVCSKVRLHALPVLFAWCMDASITKNG